MALHPIDKKVVDAFLASQKAEGRILFSDGTVLTTRRRRGHSATIAEWSDEELFVNDEYSSRTEQSAATYLRKAAQKGLLMRAAARRYARKKKKAQDERQPGQVSNTLRRRMGDALAEIFDQFGPEIYSDVVVTLKDAILERFKSGFDDMESTVKEELGRRGVEESRHHIRAWANEIVEDVNHFGLDEVAGALEDYVGTLTAEYMQPEEGEDILEVPDDELEEVEEVSEEEVEEPEEEPAEEEEEEVPEEELEEIEIELPEAAITRPRKTRRVPRSRFR